jgi:hypothetical protein
MTIRTMNVPTPNADNERLVRVTLQAYASHFGANVPLRDLIGRTLRAELDAGVPLSQTETLAALATFESLDPGTGSDAEKAVALDDVALDRAARALMQSDAEVKSLHERSGFSPAFALALEKADRQLRTS